MTYAIEDHCGHTHLTRVWLSLSLCSHNPSQQIDIPTRRRLCLDRRGSNPKHVPADNCRNTNDQQHNDQPR